MTNIKFLQIYFLNIEKQLFKFLRLIVNLIKAKRISKKGLLSHSITLILVFDYFKLI